MPEPIDRLAALAEIDATIEGSLQRPEDVYIDKGLMMARTIIEKLPAIQTEQHIGHIEHRKHIDYCSECGAPLLGYRFYCGKCGARMGGGEQDAAD